MLIRRLACLAALCGSAGLLAAAPAHGAQASTRIVNGTVAGQGAWPAQAALAITTGGKTYLCGGSLVSKRYVLTAGHCADFSGIPPASAFKVRLGSNNVNSGGTVHNVEAVTRHASYGGDPPSNDLALLYLSSPSTQEPIRIVTPLETALWSPGTQATVVGWGKLEPDLIPGDDYPTTLRQTTIPMVTDSSCSSVWGGQFSATTMVCAGGATQDSCNGDSGGPLMVPRAGRMALMGVVSWGATSCGTSGVPGVYARIGSDPLNAWIKARIPTVSIGVPALTAGTPTTLTATADQPGAAPTSYAWDLDGDGGFDDATGATAPFTPLKGSTTTVGVRTTYTDNDGAVSREVVTVPGTPDPPAPAPPVVTPPGPTAPPVTPPVATVRPVVTQLAALPTTVKLSNLRSGKVAVDFSCARACSATARLTASKAVAKKLKLSNRTLGQGRASLAAAGEGELTITLTAKARKALKAQKKVKLALRVRLVVGSTPTVRSGSITARK